MNQPTDRNSARPAVRDGQKINLNPALAVILPEWYAKNARPMPWRRDRDPYRVWVSEIMLQQTRAKVVRGYYVRFLNALPSVGALADADEEQLIKLWEGLGYYSRARNLQKAARMIVQEYGGRFPDTRAGLLKLPGVGLYTAGAIASICYDLPCAAVDGNVLRIAARIAGIAEPVDAPRIKSEIAAALEAIYPAGRCNEFTQSLMELGAVICLPNGAPGCAACPVNGLCFAYRSGAVARYPVKREKKARRTEARTVFLLLHDGRIALRRRDKQGLLAGLWELPNVPGQLDAQGALDLAAQWGVCPIAIVKSVARAHVFTHIRWEMICYSIECMAEPANFVWADRAALGQSYALPSAFRMFVDEQ
jgi:A/G-specific adenine glycosylase